MQSSTVPAVRAFDIESIIIYLKLFGKSPESIEGLKWSADAQFKIDI
jgi:hypothetical protein